MTAVLLATAVTDEGGAAAALRWEDATVLRRLLEQLADLGVRRAHVITRPAWEASLRSSIDGLDLSVLSHPSPSTAQDLLIVAQLAGAAGPSGLVLADADVVTHREALAGLLVDPRIVTGILVSGGSIGWPFVARTRTARGRTVSAGSAYHVVGDPNAGFLGVLKIAPADSAALAEVAQRLAQLTEGPLPPGWEEELARKPAMWREWLEEAKRRERAEGAEAVTPQELAAITLTPEEEAELARRAAVAPSEIVSLLLVGLVRGGTHVASSYLRRLFWARPLSRAAAEDAARQITEHDEDRVLLESAVKANDGFFTTFFVSPYSKYLARWAARLGWTPNGVTSLSMAIGLLAAAAFAVGDRAGLVAGAVLLQVAFTADCVDGQLARYTRTFSKLGAWLDSVFDRAKEYAVFAGLALGASRGLGDDVWLLAGCALTLQTVRHTLGFSFATADREEIGHVRQPALEQPLDGAATVQRLSELGAPRGATGKLTPAAPAPAAALPRSTRQLPALGLTAWRIVDRLPGARWVKRMIAFPIGERFAVISISAALWTPRVTFTVLLAWGALALCYGLAGQILRALSR